MENEILHEKVVQLTTQLRSGASAAPEEEADNDDSQASENKQSGKAQAKKKKAMMPRKKKGAMMPRKKKGSGQKLKVKPQNNQDDDA